MSKTSSISSLLRAGMKLLKLLIGATQSDSNGITFINNTAAAAGAQQYSPPLIFAGQGWKTTATAASQDVRFRAYVIPVQGTTNASANFAIESSINSASYANQFLFSSGGVLTVASQVLAGGVMQASFTSLTTTSTDGLVARNTSSATSGVPVQISPRIRLTGTAWNTGGTPATNTDDFIIENKPISGNPTTSKLVFSSQINAGGYNERFALLDNGLFYLGGTALTANQLVAANSGATGMVGVTAPIIRASADLTSQTAAVTVTSYAVGASDGEYEISGRLTIVSVVTDVLNLQVQWTDETNTARTQTFYPLGTTTPSIGSTGAYPFTDIEIRVKANTTITLVTILTTSIGSINYNVGGTIKQLR